MLELEPHYNWRALYVASDDPRSPFFGKEYSEFYASNTIYNYFIHPQWDECGSPTLYLKILFVSYEQAYCIIELMGEWNDAIGNDIMYLYQNIIELLLEEGINKFILIGENVLNYHSDITDYYEEWFENLGSDGWIAGINFRNHIIKEFTDASIDYYISFGGTFDELEWRNLFPDQLYEEISLLINKRLNA